MAVRNRHVAVAVAIEVVGHDPESEQRQGGGAEPHREGVVHEEARRDLAIEVVRLEGEVGHQKVESQVAVEVLDLHPHTRLRASVGAERRAGHDPRLLEAEIAPVEIDEVGRGVVGNIDVGESVVVEIGHRHGQALAQLGRNVDEAARPVVERPVAPIPVEQVGLAVEE